MESLSKAVRLAIALLIVAAVSILYSFYNALIEAGYGATPETLTAARTLSASLAVLVILSLRFSTQLLVAVSTAYVLLELTLIPNPSLYRMIAFTTILYLTAKAREGLDVKGLKPLATSSTMYLIGVSIGVATLIAVEYMRSLPLKVLTGDVAIFYSYLSVTRALGFIAFIAAIAVISRIIISLIELLSALRFRESYSTVALESFLDESIKDLAQPLSRTESMGLWLASTMMSLLLVTLVYEALLGGTPPTLASVGLIAIALTILTAAGRIVLARLMAGSWAPLVLASLVLGLAILTLAGFDPLYEAIGLTREPYEDPFSPIAMKELGLSVEEALRNAEVLAKILIKLFWGG